MTRDEILKLMIAGTLASRKADDRVGETRADFVARKTQAIFWRFTSNIDINKITRQEFEHICL